MSLLTSRPRPAELHEKLCMTGRGRVRETSLGVLQSRLFTNANDECLRDDVVDDASKERIRKKQLDVTARLELAATVDPRLVEQRLLLAADAEALAEAANQER